MKKIMCVILISVLGFSLAACAKKENPVVEEIDDEPEQKSDITWIIEPQKEFEDLRVLDYYYDSSSTRSSYLTFCEKGLWGIINDKFEVVVQPISAMPAFFCSGDIIHIETYDMYNITLSDGITVHGGGHGGSAQTIVYNLGDSRMYVYLSNESSSEIVLLSDYRGPLLEVMSFKYVEIFYNETWGSYDYEDKWLFGYCDRTGKILSDKQYEYAEEFHSGVAAVRSGGRWGYVDTRFNSVTGYIYQPCYGSFYYKGLMEEPFFAYSFTDGFAPVMSNAKYGVIDSAGNLILPCEYDKIVPLTGGRAIIKADGKWGIAKL